MLVSGFRWLKVLVVWATISVLMQVGFLYFLERQIIDGPATADPGQKKAVERVVNLPAAQVRGLKASPGKDYLAYTDDKGLRVFNVKTSKVVFSVDTSQTVDILAYHWLPDRNALLVASKEPVVNTKTKGNSGTSAQKLQTTIYSIGFPAPDGDTKLDEGDHLTITGFPADGKIVAMDLSTFTNSIYALVTTPRDHIVYEIDVMKNTWSVQKPGEKVFNMVTSNLQGTLYIQSDRAGIQQIVVIKHPSKWQVLREQLLRGSQYVLLGVQDNKVLVGKVVDNILTQILSLQDTGLKEKIATTTNVEWEGSIPWKDYKAIIGQQNYWVFYNQDQAVVLQEGKVREVKYTADKDFLTHDGKELMQVVTNPDGTVKVTIKPL